ncbi:MAG: metalloregulator ArsR/SmtB family transcription factor [Alphaproteobacteria bacterium]|nr:metalloregulator ArsR/SmtB family transcription factor [Alphaproteobacteria bacterium]
MEASVGEAESLLKALGNRNRLLIVCHLVEGPRSVGDLGAELGLKDPAVSQHLSVLRRDRIVVGRKEGQTVYYALAPGPAEKIVRTLHAHFCGGAGKPKRTR